MLNIIYVSNVAGIRDVECRYLINESKTRLGEVVFIEFRVRLYRVSAKSYCDDGQV